MPQDNENKKYYFYNPQTGCSWKEDMTSIKKERFLQNRPWIEEVKEKVTGD